jgi:hypothetical protein
MAIDPGVGKHRCHQPPDATDEAVLQCKRRRLISLRSQPSHQKEYDENDQDDTDNTDASVTVSVAVTPEAATEAPEQEDDEDDDKYESNRHDFSPL